MPDFAFTSGRIVLNRTIKIDRFIDINFQQRTLTSPSEYGDSSDNQKNYDNHSFLFDNLNRQSNA